MHTARPPDRPRRRPSRLQVIDLDSFPTDQSSKLQEALLALDGILSTRIIFTGSVAEGPAAFYVKDVEVCG